MKNKKEFSIDLQIHSALSPCADSTMTPNNIINMCILKGIDIISITDHNTADNLLAIENVAVENGIMLLPGIEVQTREEVHVLCYFKTASQAVELGNIIYNKLPSIKNSEEIFGKQLIIDKFDNITGTLDKLLLSSADVSIKQLLNMVNSMDGVCVPAHIDRRSYSIISNLGFIPQNLNLKTIEISRMSTIASILLKYPYLKDLRVIRSSDAHYLWDINEKQEFVLIENLTLTNILNYLRGV